MIMKNPKPNASLQQGTSEQKIRNLITYIADQSKTLKAEGNPVILTNCVTSEIETAIEHMTVWATLRKATNQIRHVVISLDIADRILMPEEWQRVVDIYLEARKVNGALYFAMIHIDGHDNRHPHHCHLAYTTSTCRERLVPTRFDADVHRKASRRAERELGLVANRGNKYSGRNRLTQKMRRNRVGVDAPGHKSLPGTSK